MSAPAQILAPAEPKLRARNGDLFKRRTFVGSLSGGEGSWQAIRRHVDRQGADDLVLLFTDTIIEDQDTYRFLIAGAANLLSVALPDGFLPEISDFPAWEDREAYKAFALALAARVHELMPALHWIADGRDPWDVYETRRFLGNSQRDPCSEHLKRILSRRWLEENCDPTGTSVILGLDHEEIERFEGGAKTPGYRARMAADGWTAIAPLCEAPFLSWADRRARLLVEGLWQQRLSVMGFAHSNCGGHCCKGGQGHWRKLHQHFPERYDYCAQRERKLIGSLGGGVAMLKDRRAGGHRPLTLDELRTRDLAPDEASDMGACGCFTGAAA